MKNAITLMMLLAAVFSQRAAAQEGSAEQSQTPKKAVAVLAPTEGNNVTGSIEFEQSAKVVLIRGKVLGLKPNSVHGFHVHENGDCSGPAAESAGAHFNPKGMPHGGPMTGKHHAGDLGNVLSNGEGVSLVDAANDELTLDGGDHSILNRSVVIHANADDLATQPSGGSGKPVACGVIQEVR